MWLSRSGLVASWGSWKNQGRIVCAMRRNGRGRGDATGRSQDLMALSDAHDARVRDVQLLARLASRLRTHKCRFSILRSSFIPSSHTHTEVH